MESRAIIPIIIIKEIPLPIPLSVILSPSHITNIVPAVRMIIADNCKESGVKASGGLCPEIRKISRSLKQLEYLL
jgi:hypothetical protein